MNSLSRTIGLPHLISDYDSLNRNRAKPPKTVNKFTKKCSSCAMAKTQQMACILMCEVFAMSQCINSLMELTAIPAISKMQLKPILQIYNQLTPILANNADEPFFKKSSDELNELTQCIEERALRLVQTNAQLIHENKKPGDHEARLTALFENMSNGIAVYRFIDDANDFIITDLNKAAERIENINRKEVIGQKLSSVFPFSAQAGLHDVLKRVSETGLTETHTMAIQTENHISQWRENYVCKLPNGEVAVVFNDVTHRKNAEMTLQLTQFSVNHCADSLYWISADGHIKYVNDSSCKFLGYSREKLLTLTVADIDALYSAESWVFHWQTLKEKGAINLETIYRTQQGKQISVDISANYLLFEGEEYYCGFVRDISERKALQTELERQAQLDYLTGIANRRYFMEQSEMELARTARYGGALSVFMLDIDHFKQVNDNHGHTAGDRVLERVGGIFADILRETDIPGRLGGEEFAVLLPETDLEKAVEVAERLRSYIAESPIFFESGALPLSISVSIGVTTLQDHNGNINDLLNRADQALYRAKSAGRNRVCK
ncbi:MAG: diguanylate cyclase [Methylicorpusculum sp.]|uniref:sensor domain-containing diguanylate cyclase n=1 Tax=Methylicorpusculum sp. TaxID=2713644 RepID=UPI002716E0C0|nr:diguanylate cyclase [Methylicorpusculum sp.]MDO8939740.1 diguanylate cyclase [Methylicorpusculum sp.]MDO9239614.1 diguanylate cyclase [Methylicorpusculum sp.]MDP2201906.1 diguanylate cyclase [Methylicorpusculum sp.]